MPFPRPPRILRAVGFDDAPFAHLASGRVRVFGAVCAGTRFEGLVEAGLGSTLLPMPLPAPSTRVAVIPLRDPPIARTMALCWDRRRTLPPAANLFAQSLLSESSEPFDLPVSA